MENQKKVFSELIKRQMAILGPDITFAKVRNVPGITIDAVGNVTNINGDPQVLLQQLINQFVELSGLIVKKTMESILASNGMQAAAVPGVAAIPDSNTAEPGNMANANKELDDLNKMLDNLNTNH